LYVIGAEFEYSIARKKFIICCLAIVGGSHLASLLASFADSDCILCGPKYLVIGLSMAYSRYNPSARARVVGLDAPIMWVPWILAFFNIGRSKHDRGIPKWDSWPQKSRNWKQRTTVNGGIEEGMLNSFAEKSAVQLRQGLSGGEEVD
jgi:hypothetical protein